MRNTPQLYSRREFMRSGLVLTAAAGTAPSFLARTCLAAESGVAANGGNADERVLVVLQLSGGNDGLNTIIPFEDDEYHRLRPSLALRGSQIIRVNDTLGVHAALRPLQRLFDDGEITWLQGVGYPNPNRSHFRSMEIWHTASGADERLRTGWIGRYFDHTCQGAPSAALDALTVGREMPQAMRRATGHGAGIVVTESEHFSWANPGRTTTHQRQQRAMLEHLHQPADGSPTGDAIDYLRHTALQAIDSTDLIAEADRRYRATVDYPDTRFGRDLRLIATCIGGGVGGRVFYASLGGFDTHANQAGAHTRLLTQLAEGLAAFRRDLGRMRAWERVAVMGFSEFGRRADENGSRGTDHGAAGPMFVMGSAFRGGFVGPHPSLQDLGRSDLVFHTDFRSVYATLLNEWLQTDPQPVLGAIFPSVPILGPIASGPTHLSYGARVL
jgi:uncharacterized protein (DUF1501 family)